MEYINLALCDNIKINFIIYLYNYKNEQAITICKTNKKRLYS